jgi:type IX secretion system PorP/SprF family membrane protein
MMKKLLISLSFLLTSIVSLAQQVPFYNHFLINPFVYNPAYTGYSDYTNISFVRNQRFSSFGSTAVGNYLTAEGAINKRRMGVGLTVASQSQGIQQQLMSSLNYAYRLTISDNSTLRFGVAGGVLDNRIDDSDISVEQQDDPYFTGLRHTAPVFDLNVGVLYTLGGFRLGLSVPQITGGKVKYASETGRGYYQLARHFMGSVEYDFRAGKKLVIRPNALVRYIPDAPFQYDLSAMLMLDNKIWISGTYKSEYAVQLNAGFRVWDFLRVGYSYELLTGSMKAYNTGTNHEIFIGFSFREKSEPVIERVEVEREVIRVDETAIRERDSLQVLKDSLESELRRALTERMNAEKLQRERDSLAKIAKPVVRPSASPQSDSDIQVAKGYRFRELDNTASPDGYYVITGVFSSTVNAQNALERNKTRYPSTYLVINEMNGWYYVVVHYSTEPAPARKVFYELKSKQSGKVWILNYRRPPE